MKILLLGKNGQLGWELQRSLQPLGSVIALDRHRSVDGYCGDVSDFSAIEYALQQIHPNVVVNAAAYTAVDQAEIEPKQADLINHLAVAHLAQQCQQLNILLIHYSSDYVFAGGGDVAWQESDLPSPQNVYGMTKRNGEIALERSGVHFINMRTSWVYGVHGHNFIKTMLKLAKQQDQLKIVNDQIGAPTAAALIADVTAQVLRYYYLQSVHQQAQLHGHYHLAASGAVSWYEYAHYIFEQACALGMSLQLKQVHAVATADYPTPAKRPLNSRLNTQKLQQQFQLYLPPWQQGVKHVLGEIRI